MTDDEYAELQRKDRRAQIREWGFVQFAPLWQKILRSCSSGERGTLVPEYVQMWLDYLDHQIEWEMVYAEWHDAEEQVQLAMMCEAYERLERALQTKKRRKNKTPTRR